MGPPKGPGMVMVTSPGCGYCDLAKPAWNKAVEILGSTLPMHLVKYTEKNRHPLIGKIERAWGHEIGAFPSFFFIERNGTVHEMLDDFDYTDPGAYVAAARKFTGPATPNRNRNNALSKARCPRGGCKNANKSVWGPKIWARIHLTGLAYPQNPTASDRQLAKQIFSKDIPTLLPCHECKDHYMEMITTPGDLFLGPASLDSRDSLFAWTVRIHAAVNSRLGKPAGGNVEWRAVYKAALNKSNRQRGIVRAN